MGEFGTQRGEHEGPIAVVMGKPIEGDLQNLDLFSVDGTRCAEEPAVIGESCRP